MMQGIKYGGSLFLFALLIVNQIDKSNMFDFVFYQIDSVSVN